MFLGDAVVVCGTEKSLSNHLQAHGAVPWAVQIYKHHTLPLPEDDFAIVHWDALTAPENHGQQVAMRVDGFLGR